MAKTGPRERAPRSFFGYSEDFPHSHPGRRDGGQCVDDSLAMLVVTRALVQSYPTWTDEHGTNVEQLAAIAVSALAEQGLLAEPKTTLDSVRT